jgi:DNA helicase-2/ATP-dependent DNA helicase PcrA
MHHSNLLIKLNEKQQQAVCAPLTHLAVIAGAGSGKTRVLVHRIAWLIQHEKISPDRLLALTFTNKAANELKTRVEHLIHLPARNMWLGTFHSLAHRLLRLHYQRANLPQAFQILDSVDQHRLIRKTHQLLNLNNEKWPPTQSQWYINSKKNEGLRPQEVPIRSHSDRILNRVYEVYEEQCQPGGLVDFTELLLKSYELLAEDSDLLTHYQDRFAHILVDEFQDTNAIQYAWLKLLAGKNATLMVVGDDDQSIYSWRGAQHKNIYQFHQDFPAQIIRLEQNYRSTQTILAAANAVIAHNCDRYDKKLWTNGHSGDLIPLYMAFTEKDEVEYIVSQIKEWWQAGSRLQDIAVLYRSNAQSRLLEEELLSANIPYQIYGGLKFFERAEIKDALAYLRLVANPLDDVAFERVVNLPSRGIGKATLAKLREKARATHTPLWHVAENLIREGALSSRARYGLNAFLQLIQSFRNDIPHSPLPIITKQIINKSGLYAHYDKDRSDRMQSRLENLEELIETTQRFKEGTRTLSTLQSFLNYAVLESGEKQAEEGDSVQLMTLHAAKGLEFDSVFLMGMEEGLFPHKMSIAEGKLEEERRLCYVGMTRARKKLCLTYAETRRNSPQLHRYRLRSRFINEIPAELLHKVRIQPKARQSPQFLSTAFITEDTGLGYQLGERIRHPHLGEGVVLNYAGVGPRAQIQVKFHTAGTKWLMLEFAHLEKV